MEFRVNGKIYSDYDEALKAEKKFLRQKEEKEKKEKELEKRKQEVCDAYDHYEKLMAEFKKDYPDYFTFNWNDFFRQIF